MMKKTVHRILSFLLMIVLAMSTLQGSLLTVKAATVSESLSWFNSKVSSFLSDGRWSDGIAWSSSQRQKISTCSSTGCAAYVNDFTTYVFNHNASIGDGDSFTSVSEIREGDVIHFKETYYGNEHYFAVIGRNGNSLTTIEGNYSGKVSKATGRFKRSIIWHIT